MPYYRRRARYSRKRTYRRRGSTLSTKNLLTRKSATAQALQLRAVNRKVNRIYKMCKPEMKVSHGDSMDFTFQNGALSSVSHGWNAPAIPIGPGPDARIGDKIWRRDTYSFTLTYGNNASETHGWMSEKAAAGQIRCILCIDKIPSGQNSLVNHEMLLHNTGDLLTYKYWMSAPFEDGITERLRIVYDKIHTVTLDRPIKHVRISTPWYLCRFDDTDESDPPVIQSHLCLVSGDLYYGGTTENVFVYGTRKTIYKDA